MFTAESSPQQGGFNSCNKRIERVTGYVQADIIFDDMKRAEPFKRAALARAFASAAGEGRGKYPTYVSAGQLYAALDAVAALCGEVADSPFVDELFDVAADTEAVEIARINRSVLDEWAAELGSLVIEPGLQNLCSSQISDPAEMVGRFCDLSPSEIVAGIAGIIGIADVDPAITHLRHGAEIGSRARVHDRTAAEDFFDFTIQDRSAAGLPIFESYDIDSFSFSPSPPEFYAIMAEKEAAEREIADAASVAAAEASIAGRVGTMTTEDFLALVCAVARSTLGSNASTRDLARRLMAAAEVDATAYLQNLVETSIRAARDDHDKLANATAKRVAKIEGVSRAALAAPLASFEAAIVAAAPSQSEAESEKEAVMPSIVAPRAPTAAPRQATFDADAPIEVMPAPAAGLTPEDEMEALTHLPGLVGELVDWFCATSRTPNRTLAFSAALVFLGTLAGRIYKSPTGIRTNLYALGLAPSGHGKDAARKCIDSLATAGGFSEWIAGDGIASGSGMRKRVEQHPAIMWKIDEFGGFMRKIGDQRASHHTKQIRDNLLTYYGSAGSVFRGEDYAGERGSVCHHPNVGIYGTATPIDFWGACQSLSVGDGILARFLIFNVGGERKRPKGRPASADYETPPVSLIGQCRAVAEPKCGGNVAHLMDGSRPSKPLAVAYAKGAETAFEEMVETFADRADSADREEEAFWHRAVENATKIALIVAIGIDPDKPLLTVDGLRLGQRVVELCVEGTLREIKGRLADNDRQREHIYLRRIIEEAGPTGITRTALCVKMNGKFPASRRDDILQTLEKDEKSITIVFGDNTRGPRGARFIAVCHLKEGRGQ